MVTWSLIGPVQDGPNGSTAEVIDSTGLGALEWVTAASILVAGVVLSMLVRRVVVGILRRGTSTETIAERLIGRLLQAVIVLVALSYSFSVLGVRIGPLLGALGIGGIAVALALQETLKNLFAGVILHAQRPLRMGEEVVTGEIQGTVIDITSRAVTIRTNSGRTVFVPNSVVLDREIVNLVRHGVRRTTLVVGVAYGTDLERAREVIHTAAAGADGVLPDKEVRVLGLEFADSSVNFDVDFWHGPREPDRRRVASNVVLAVHEALGDAGITIPFPQRTLWFGSDPAVDDGSESRAG